MKIKDFIEAAFPPLVLVAAITWLSVFSYSSGYDSGYEKASTVREAIFDANYCMKNNCSPYLGCKIYVRGRAVERERNVIFVYLSNCANPALNQMTDIIDADALIIIPE